ncbi:MAG: hypothetical protein AB7C97_05310 [Oscillospiraceae bacterium]
MEEISKKVIDQALTHEGETLVDVYISYPGLMQNTRGARRVDRFYEHSAKKLLFFAKHEIMPLAAKARKICEDEGCVFSSVSVKTDFYTTFFEGNCLSLWREVTVSGLEGCDTTRYGDTWDISCGLPLTLRDLLGSGYKKQLFNCEEAKKYGKRLLRKYFDSKRFWLCDGLAVVFYEPGTIAPLERGIVTFNLKRPVIKQNGELSIEKSGENC